MNHFGITLLLCLSLTIILSSVTGARIRQKQSITKDGVQKLDLELDGRPSNEQRIRKKRQSYGNPERVPESNVFDPLRRGGMICNLCIVVDDQFVRAYKLSDSLAVITQMKGLVDRISWIFRNIDWNDDEVPDNIGFQITNLVQGWNPYPYESPSDYGRSKPSLTLLGQFSQHDFTSCCLGIGFTNRPFDESQVGVSFIASTQTLGGICDYRTPEAPLKSSNVILISSIGFKGTQLSIKDIGVVLLHELGHAFGILKHDIDTDSLECSGFEKDDILPADYKSEKLDPPLGRYVMWGQDIQGLRNVKANSLNFSSCSRLAVTELLNSGQGRASCLVANEASFCGNGIVEYPEECDCGNEISCAKIGCCGSRSSSGPCQFFNGIKPSNCPLLKDTKRKKKKNAATSNLFSLTPYLILGQLCFVNIIHAPVQ